MSTLKKGDRIRVVTCSRPEYIGTQGTVLEDSTSGVHTRRGIPVETAYIRFDVAQRCDQGFDTTDIVMPVDQLERI